MRRVNRAWRQDVTACYLEMSGNRCGASELAAVVSGCDTCWVKLLRNGRLLKHMAIRMFGEESDEGSRAG
jgi:hypothetical protein